MGSGLLESKGGRFGIRMDDNVFKKKKGILLFAITWMKLETFVK